MVAEGEVVAGQAEDVLDPVHIGAQHIALDGQAVAVATGHLDDRLQAGILHQDAGADAAEADDTGLIVGDVGRVHLVLEQADLLGNESRVHAHGRSEFCRDGKMALGQNTFQIAAGLQPVGHWRLAVSVSLM